MVRPILPSITTPYITLSLSLTGFPSGPGSGVSVGPAVISTSYSPGSKGDTKGNLPLQRPGPAGASSTTPATRSPAFTIWAPALTRVPMRTFPLKAESQTVTVKGISANQALPRSEEHTSELQSRENLV